MILVTKSSKTVKNRKNLGTVDLSRFEKVLKRKNRISKEYQEHLKKT